MRGSGYKILVVGMLFLIFCMSGLSSCALEEVCDLMSGNHIDRIGECVRDTDEECGNGGPGRTPLNCKIYAGATDGKCVNGGCVALKCKEKRYFLEEGKCVAYTRDNCKDGYHMDLSNDCVEDTDEACGEDLMNCKLPEWGSNGKCSNGKCSVVGGACLSGYRYSSESMRCELVDGSVCFAENKIYDPDTHECIERCNCNMNETCERMHACELERCNDDATICVKTVSDLERLRDKLGKKEVNVVYLLNDINLSEGREDCNSDWKSLPDIETLTIMTFGMDYITITNEVGEKRCTMQEGLFKKLENVSIYNLNVDYDIKGDKTHGLLSDRMHYVYLSSVAASGKLEYTGKNTGYSENVCEVDSAVGIGGIAGRMDNSRLYGVSSEINSIIADDASYVGGIAGMVCKSELIEVTSRIRERINGQDYVGGMAGYLDGESYVDYGMNYMDGTLAGHSRVGGAFGELEGDIQYFYNNAQNVIGVEIKEDSLDEGFGVDDACYELMQKGDEYVGKYVGGFAGYVKGTSYIEKARNMVQYVVGCNEVGGYIGEIHGVSDNSDSNEVEYFTSYVEKVYADGDSGGYVGKIGKNSMINNAYSEVREMTCGTTCGGFFGSNEGRVDNVESHVENLKGKFLIGGFGYSVYGDGIVSNVKSYVEKITLNSFGGGFLALDDGIVRKVYNNVGEIRGHRGIGGAFSGAAGTIERFENRVGKVIGLSCKEIPSQYVAIKNNYICMWEDCIDSQRLEECVTRKRLSQADVDERKRAADVHGVYVGGFLATSDAERSMSYTDIVNRVDGVYGSESLGGFLGRYGGSVRYQVHLDLRNISTYANVYRIGDVGVDYGLTEDFGGFIGNNYSTGDGGDLKFYHAQNYENIVSMSHFYQLKKKGQNIGYDDIRGQDDFEEVYQNNVFGAMRASLDDDVNVDKCDVSLIYATNFYYYNYDKEGNEALENSYLKAMYDAEKINPIQYGKLSRNDYIKQCYIQKLNDSVGYASHYGMVWCMSDDKVGNKEILTLTLVDPEIEEERKRCIDPSAIESRCKNAWVE